MAVRIELKRSNVPGKIPSTSQLQLGEVALNTYDGAAYFKKNVGGTETIVQLATTTGTGSGTVTSASHADYADTAGYATNAGNAATAVSASYAFNASNAVSSSYAVTASHADNAPNAVSASYARTASYSDNFNVGNNLTVVGTITAQKLVVQVITSSTEFVTGSTKFGSQLTDTHQFTGSVSITGSLSVNGIDYIQTSASFDGRINGISGSFITSASFNSFTASTNDSLADIKNATASLYNATASIYNATQSLYAFSASILNYTASNDANIAALNAATASLYNATASIYATTQSLSASIGLLSSSFLSTSSSLSTRVYDLEQFSSSLDATFATDAQLNYSSSVLSGSTAYLSSSFLTVSASNSTRILALENFSSSLDATFATDADLNALSASFKNYTSSLNNFSASILSYTASQNILNGTFATTGSNIFKGNQTISGSLAVSGSTNIFGTTNVTGSVNVSGGVGNIFTANVDTIVFTGSFVQSGSVNINGNVTASNALIGGRDYITDSGSFSTRVFNLEQFSSSLDNTFATDADLNALSSSFIAFTASINNYTASNNNNIAALYAATASLNNATASLYNFSASINSYTASNNDVVAQLYNETASLKAATASLYSATQSLYEFSASILNFTSSTNNAIAQLYNATASLYRATSSLYNATSSLYAFSASINSFTASQLILNGKYATTASNTFIGNQIISGSLNVTSGITGSLLGTASFAVSASYASFAATSSTSTEARDIIIPVKNLSGAQINKGSVVRITGSVGDNALISLADYNNDNLSANTLGLVTSDIPDNSFGYVMTEGTFIGYDTSTPGWTPGQVLYLGANGTITGSAPLAPLHGVRLGQVLRIQQNNGSIYVRIDNGYEIGELHDVRDFTTTGSYGDLLIKSGSVWTNSRSLTGSYSLTGSLDGGTINSTSLTASNALITNNLTVNGTASFNYVQTVTGSAVIVGQEYIILNTQTPAARYAGIKVYDSGSNSTASIVWDSETNHWVYENQTGSSYNGGGFLAGPRNTGSLADITYPTQYRVLRSQGDDHVYDSNIIDNDIKVSIGLNTEVTGNLYVANGITGSLLGNVVGNLTGTASYWSGSITNALSSSFASTASFVQTAQTSSYVLNAVSASFASTASFVRNAVSASWAAFASQSANATQAFQSSTVSISGISTNAEYTFPLILTGSSGPSMGLNTDTVTGIFYNPSTNLFRSTNIAATGSLLGTASFANTATSASFAATASYWSGSIINAVSASFADNANNSINAQTASYVVLAQSASYWSGSIQNAVSAAFADFANSASFATTASFALNAGSGGGGGISAIYIADEGIVQGTASYFDFTGTGVTATVSNGSASINITGGGGGSAVQGASQTFTQSIAATTWSIAHSINSRTPVIEVYDTSYDVVIPTRINNIGPFQSVIYFDIAQAGYAIISTGGVLAVSGSNAVLNQTAAATTWSFNHDLHTQYPVFTIYDSNDDVIIPQRIHVVDTGSAEIYFSTPRTGKAIASVGGNVSFASQSLNTVTASFAATASSADDFLVRGTITAQTLLVQVITSSQDFVTGSTKFGTLLSNTHQFTGSVLVTGSLNVNGSDAILTNQTSSMSVLSSSYAATASFALNVPQTASFALSASNAVTASYIATASFALTASYAENAGAGAGFPYSGSAVITGSLLVSESFVDFSRASWVSGSFTGSLNGTASWANNAISASYAAVAGNSPGFTVNFTQSVAAATWSFVHNLNTRNPIVQVYDTTYKQIIPNEIVATDSATVEVRFDYNQAGYAVASNGGGLYITGSTSRILQTVAATTWSFNHKLNTKYPAFEVFDSNDNVIIPAGIKAVDTDNAEIYFASPTTGIAIAEFSGINGLQDNAVSASFATTASYAVTATSASFASTASYLNPVTSGYVVLTQVSQSLNFVDDAAAATGGVPLGGLYRNGNFIMIRLT